MNEINDKLNIHEDNPIDLVVLAVKRIGIRCKVLDTGEPVTFRKVRDEIPGEILTVKPSKVWRYHKTNYLSGEVIDKRTDISSLGLKPFELKNEWLWKPEDECRSESGEPVDPYSTPIIEFGERKSFEMEQIIPGQDPENFDTDPIIEAVDYYNSGDSDKAYKIMENILTTDLRCLDAHSHLGCWEFNRSDSPKYTFAVEKAKKHYEVGVKIGDLSLEERFNDVLPWGRIDNRPFLRCLYGYGLCLWRLGNIEEARKIFERMLWLNPSDNQGIRFLLACIDEGKTWYERDDLSTNYSLH